jgi:hypothetical protein
MNLDLQGLHYGGELLVENRGTGIETDSLMREGVVVVSGVLGTLIN